MTHDKRTCYNEQTQRLGKNIAAILRDWISWKYWVLITLTALKMMYCITFLFEIFTTTTTTTLFDVWVNQVIKSQLISCPVVKRFGHSLQKYSYTCPWRRRECWFILPRVMNCLWQMSHVNQVPSLCDFSRCALSWSSLLKQSEQSLHEYGFTPVWIRTWSFSSVFTLNNFPQ